MEIRGDWHYAIGGGGSKAGRDSIGRGVSGNFSPICQIFSEIDVLASLLTQFLFTFVIHKCIFKRFQG